MNREAGAQVYIVKIIRKILLNSSKESKRRPSDNFECSLCRHAHN